MGNPFKFASLATSVKPAAAPAASALSASAVPMRPMRFPGFRRSALCVRLAVNTALVESFFFPSSESLYQGARSTASSSISPSLRAAAAAAAAGDKSGARAGSGLPLCTAGALNIPASAATLSVHTRHMPHSTCLLASGLSSFSSPYVPSSSPEERTSSATSGPSAKTLTFKTRPHKPPSSAHFFAAATDRLRGSAWCGRQSEIIITGYKPCSARMMSAASGSKEENKMRRAGCARHTPRTARSSATKRGVAHGLCSSNLSSMLNPSSGGACDISSSRVGISSSTSITQGSGSSLHGNLR
mmetsp:Transcript_7718/g.32182  ORF Transcript_7718/g.32182 Transcript_7718/m.32182 type:complete len:300 (-) Transcript_7718:1700-2599(-)